MTAAIAAVVLITLAVTFVVVYRETGSEMRKDIDGDVRSDANQLASSLRGARVATGRQLLALASTYAGPRTYRDSQSILFVIVPGTGTTSNYSEVRRLAVPKLGYATQPTPDVGTLRTYEIRLDVGGIRAYAGAGETLEMVTRAQSSVARAFLVAGGVVLALAILVAYLLGARISAPLRRMAEVAARVDGGELGPRMQPPPTSSSELRALAETFNNMLDRLALAFEGQRQFVADASHELRTPLTVMRGQLDLLAKGVNPGAADDADAAETAAEVQRVERLLQAELARVSRLVDELLLLAQSERADFLRPERVDLAELVTELWDGLSLTAARDFQIGTLVPATVVADPDRLAQALRNLARNAIAHTREPDGVVRVELHRAANAAVRLAVSDDGPGVPPQARARVFERFYRTDPARTRADGGAGLGLAIARAIVEAHHGTISVTESKLGGARFEVELPGPVAAPAAPELRRPGSSARPPA